MMSCQEVRRLAERFVAMELPHGDEHAVRQHLQGCRECRELYLVREPALLFALEPLSGEAVEDDAFVAGVLGGVRERRLERVFRLRRQRWMAAAAVVAMVVLGGLGGLKLGAPKPDVVTGGAVAARPEPADDPPFVTVEGDDVSLYQVTLASEPGVQVAFVVDPNLEL